jgi:protein-disulfide isomerase
MEEKLSKKERREQAKLEKQKLAESSLTTDSVKKFAIPAIIVIAVLFGGYKLWQWIQTPTAPSPVAAVEIPVDESDWVKGSAEASVTLIEFSDFQCPACRAYYPLVKQLTDEFPDDLRVVYKHFPLTTVHLNAYDAAVASEAAGVQGKFWEMHDILFERQTEWESENDPAGKFAEYAKEIGLDEEKFRSDLASSELAAGVDSDVELGNSLGVNATPTFYLKGGKISVPPQSFEQFKSLIETARGQ